ncbi:Wadjet anti-phage system protein JetD domain-containing protein [Endozoicomonas numazuensis]|uniref:Wadjet protein JetD C-terminal domain-containing protein n=1 Tax=Endozoicomonas numazuensis TaxID=1137799 RepID=A0A081NLT9_9GAMM|nr:Wadjet anti-phage system protein JetD domain-containing protein [Endozoicomonas numazuensis]KEQ19412.1 hypothetical protein GZ78_05520 [Endozoicomonas numazuensis]
MLDLIANGEPIKWNVLVRAFVKEGFNPPEIERILVPAVGKGLALVSIIDHKEFIALRRRYPSRNLRSKATAALSGHSHDAKNRASLLNISIPYSEHPVCATALSEKGWIYPFREEEFGHDAVIVENLENFLHSDKTRRFIIETFSLNASDPLVLIWGGGKAAEKKQHIEFFQRFKRIHVLPDLDYEGLAIAARLAKKLNNFGEFLVPTDIGVYLSISSRHMSPEESEKLQELATKEPKLSTVIGKLVNAELTLEQEIYLLEPGDYGHT